MRRIRLLYPPIPLNLRACAYSLSNAEDSASASTRIPEAAATESDLPPAKKPRLSPVSRAQSRLAGARAPRRSDARLTLHAARNRTHLHDLLLRALALRVRDMSIEEVFAMLRNGAVAPEVLDLFDKRFPPEADLLLVRCVGSCRLQGQHVLFGFSFNFSACAHVEWLTRQPVNNSWEVWTITCVSRRHHLHHRTNPLLRALPLPLLNAQRCNCMSAMDYWRDQSASVFMAPRSLFGGALRVYTSALSESALARLRSGLRTQSESIREDWRSAIGLPPEESGRVRLLLYLETEDSRF